MPCATRGVSRGSGVSRALRLSVAICTKDRPEDVARCLAACARQTRLPDELLIVDASAAPLAPEKLPLGGTPLLRRVQWLCCEPGLAKQRNMALDAAKGDVLLFLDDDAEADSGVCAALTETFASDPAIAGACPRVEGPYDPPGRWRFFCRVFMLPREDGRGQLQPSGFLAYPFRSGQANPIEIAGLPGCAMAYRRSAIEGLRFDAFFDGYGFMEDVDFSVRAGQRGPLRYLPGVRVVHRESPMSRLEAAALGRMQAKNHAYVCRKLLGRAGPAYGWSELGLLLAAVRTCKAQGSLALLRGRLRGLWEALGEVVG